MKKLILLLVPVCMLSQLRAQSVTECPLNMSTIPALPVYLSASGPATLWVAMQGFIPGQLTNDKTVAKTTDGGANWDVFTIPETADRGGACICALDNYTAWVGLTDINDVDGGSIWKTTDGGLTWNQETTTEFNGGWLEYLTFFDAGSGVAFGDPNDGYFEIYTTSDGGTTWSRVPEANIPPVIPGEYGNGGNAYGISGDRVWFATSKGRILYSYDRGLHWSVSVVNPAYGYVGVTMSDTLNGAAWKVQGPQSLVYLTSDGGQTWNSQAVSLGEVDYLTAVPGVPGTFYYKDFGGIYATTDNFAHCALVSDAFPLNGNSIIMFDALVGWTQTAVYKSDSAILRIGYEENTGIGKTDAVGISALGVFPNPVVTGHAVLSWMQSAGGTASITILDLTGRIILQDETAGRQGNNTFLLNLGNIASGIYLAQVRTSFGSVSCRICIR